MINLFGIPIYHNNINLEKNEKDFLMNSKYERTGLNNGFLSVDKNILKNKNVKNILKNILFNLNIFLYENLNVKKDIKFKLLNSWCTKHKKNDYAHRHLHSNSFISGVLYLKTNENSGDLTFHKNVLYNNLFYNSVKINFDKCNVFNSDCWYFTPEEGDLFFFPSHLEHSVTNNMSDDDRFCCAFNFYPCGVLGSNEEADLLKL